MNQDFGRSPCPTSSVLRESRVSTLPTSSRLMRASPAKFSSSANISVFEGLYPRSQRCATILDLLRPDQPERRILGEPLGIIDFLIACRAAVDGLNRSATGNCVFLPRRESLRCSAMRSPKPNRSSNSRTRMTPPSEVTRDPWKSNLSVGLKES